ncbi:cytochrome P450 [Hymenopellis radicata]|nr:cytochrome P450 [Hymenopellis radicata]
MNSTAIPVLLSLSPSISSGTPILTWSPILWTTGILCLLGAVTAAMVLNDDLHKVSPLLERIPRVYGRSGIVDLVKAIVNTQAYLHDGYRKTKGVGGLFKLPTPTRWVVVATDPETMRDIYRGSDNDLSSSDAIEAILQFSHTLGPEILDNPYHVPLMTSLLSKRLDEICPGMFEELEYVFKKSLEVNDIHGHTFLENVVSSVSNRIFVGLSLCRNQRFLQLTRTFTFRMTIVGFILSGTPSFLRRFLAFLISPNRVQAKIAQLVQPVVLRQRQAMVLKDPKLSQSIDVLSNMMAIAEGKEQSAMALTLRIMHLNFAAVSSTSIILPLAFNHLASRQDWQDEIAAEVQEIIDQEGWSFRSPVSYAKVGLTRERIRTFAIFVVAVQSPTKLSLTATLGRVVTAPSFTFSNGITVPRGTLLCATSRELCLDNTGTEFQPFRFVKEDEIRLATDSSTTSTPQYMPWGHGKHACPGRFFAVCQMKAIIAYTFFHYRVSVANQRQPTLKWLFVMSAPDKSLQFRFEPRQRDVL